jgi:TPR repeat protein
MRIWPSFDGFKLPTVMSRELVNETKAALLYAIAAAEHGDISSIVALGWFVQKGKAGICPTHTDSLTHVIGVEKNITLVKLLYAKAGELEAVYTTYGLSWATTQHIILPVHLQALSSGLFNLIR